MKLKSLFVASLIFSTNLTYSFNLKTLTTKAKYTAKLGSIYGQQKRDFHVTTPVRGPITAGFLYWLTKTTCYGAIVGGATAAVVSTGGTALGAVGAKAAVVAGAKGAAVWGAKSAIIATAGTVGTTAVTVSTAGATLAGGVVVGAVGTTATSTAVMGTVVASGGSTLGVATAIEGASMGMYGLGLACWFLP